MTTFSVTGAADHPARGELESADAEEESPARRPVELPQPAPPAVKVETAPPARPGAPLRSRQGWSPRQHRRTESAAAHGGTGDACPPRQRLLLPPAAAPEVVMRQPNRRPSRRPGHATAGPCVTTACTVTQ